MKIKVINKEGRKIKISKETTDPECLRVSMGGREEVGYYLTFRGDNMQEIEDMLVETTEAFKEAHLKYKKQNN